MLRIEVSESDEIRVAHGNTFAVKETRRSRASSTKKAGFCGRFGRNGCVPDLC
jgi:hypothetical protein